MREPLFRAINRTCKMYLSVAVGVGQVVYTLTTPQQPNNHKQLHIQLLNNTTVSDIQTDKTTCNMYCDISDA